MVRNCPSFARQTVSQPPVESKPDVSTSEFADAAVASGLVRAVQIDRARQIAGTDDPQMLGDTLVRAGVLTAYQRDQLLAGRTKLTLGPYVITDWIGQGGMGQVFKAVHRVMGRVVAVKVLPLEKSTEASRDSFLREIRLQAELDHPNVVRAFDAGHDGNVHYLVTEFVPGTDLRRLIREEGPLSQTRAAAIGAQVARGLGYAHEIGLVHRDIKPGNVLVTPDGTAKLSDIGLATWSMGLDDDPRAGKIVGTADYLSPEQIRTPRAVGPASDIYSLGCTLYHAVTGKVPFPGGTPREKCRRHCDETPWHPHKFKPELSDGFVDVIADMMDKDPAGRLSGAGVVADRLAKFAGGSMPPGESHRVGGPGPPRPHQMEPAFGVSDNGFDHGTHAPAVAMATAAMAVANHEHPTGASGATDSRDPLPNQSGGSDRSNRRRHGHRSWIARTIWNALMVAIGLAAGLLARPELERWLRP